MLKSLHAEVGDTHWHASVVLFFATDDHYLYQQLFYLKHHSLSNGP